MKEFKRMTNGFNYVFETIIGEGETIFLKMPPISPNKRGVNDIGWQTDGSVKLYGTLSTHPEDEGALWDELERNYDVNKTLSAIKIVNNSSPCRVVIRVILN